ncbi:MAG: hypothetical protein ACRC6F_06890 [Aeromonas sp.]
MSAFMIDRQDYQAFAMQLTRLCHAAIPPYYTLQLLRNGFWMPPTDISNAWGRRVNRLARLMMLANRRAVWHRYQHGHQQARSSSPRRSTKLSPLKLVDCDHQPALTDNELITLYKFTGSVLYQSSEWTGGATKKPRLIMLLEQFQQALAQDVLSQLSQWDHAPWGTMA